MQSLKPPGFGWIASVVFCCSGGERGDRIFQRIEQMRNKAETVLIQAEKVLAGERHAHMKEHM